MMAGMIGVSQSQSLELSVIGHSLKGFRHRPSSAGSDRASLDRTQIHHQHEHSYRFPSALSPPPPLSLSLSLSLPLHDLHICPSFPSSYFSLLEMHPFHVYLVLEIKPQVKMWVLSFFFILQLSLAVVFLSSHNPLINGRNSPGDQFEQGCHANRIVLLQKNSNDRIFLR